jgi:hypothetical protein
MRSSARLPRMPTAPLISPELDEMLKLVGDADSVEL